MWSESKDTQLFWVFLFIYFYQKLCYDTVAFYCNTFELEPREIFRMQCKLVCVRNSSNCLGITIWNFGCKFKGGQSVKVQNTQFKYSAWQRTSCQVMARCMFPWTGWGLKRASQNYVRGILTTWVIEEKLNLTFLCCLSSTLRFLNCILTFQAGK